ncbi:hypothetical protein ACT453_59045, partial [Bacillus sp. D-CC]
MQSYTPDQKRRMLTRIFVLNHLLSIMNLLEPGIFIFYNVQKQKSSKQIFTRVELASSVAIDALAFFEIYGLITGSITL